MKKLLLLCVYIITLYSQSPMPFDDAVTKPNAYHIIELDCELFMVHMIPDMPTGSNYKVYNFPATINASGLFQLAGDITNSLTISANNVTLDMQGHTASGGLIISSGRKNVTIKDGVIDVAHTVQNAINVQGGVSQIMLDSLKVRNAINTGIAFANVTDSTIRNCDLSSNTTGIQLTTSKNIIIENCIATANINAGFDLVSSVTCLVTKCKAMSTGQSNNQITAQTIFGFSSSSGNGNIFERCIANATQALSTTDLQSIVAGFALRGDEGCSKIIDCESANTQTNVSGVTVPYGIVLEAQFDGLVSAASAGGTGDLVYTVNWSPDGAYLAVGGSLTGDDLVIYQFNRIGNSLPAITSVNPLGGIQDTIRAANWSPDGKYLAVGGIINGNYVVVYQFDGNSLTQAALVNLGVGVNTVYSIDWSPNGKYVAVVGEINGDSIVYQFDRINNSLIQVASVNTGTSDSIYSVNWSPDGTYLAIGGDITGNDLIVYRFDGNSLIPVTSDNPGINVRSVNWSPDGTYLAMGRSGGGVTYNLIIYQFDFDNGSLIPKVSIAFNPGLTVYSVNWSPDGNYLAIGGLLTGDDLIVYRFDRGTNSLTSVASVNPGGGGSDTVYSLNWSPDGGYLAIVGAITGSGGSSDTDFIIYQVFTFPSNNVIKNNTVYCNSGGKLPYGVGISGSSIANLIIGNTAYNNPIDPFLFYSNYVFVTNVFNPLFEQNPTALENIGITGPIQTPLDIALMAQQIESKLCAIQSTIDALLP